MKTIHGVFRRLDFMDKTSSLILLAAFSDEALAEQDRQTRNSEMATMLGGVVGIGRPDGQIETMGRLNQFVSMALGVEKIAFVVLPIIVKESALVTLS